MSDFETNEHAHSKDTILSIIERTHSASIMALFTILMVVLTIGVVARNIGLPIMWTDELSKVIFIWVVFLSAALAIRKGGHLALNVLKDTIKSKVHVILINALSIVILSLIIKPTIEILKIGTTSFTSMLNIPWSILYVPFLLFIIIGIIYHGAEIISIIGQNKKEDK